MKKISIVSLLVVSLGILVFCIVSKRSDNLDTFVEINKETLQVKIATTSQEKEKGLCCRDSLPQNEGMLFVYDQPTDLRFWMKDMRFPLDMIWIDHNKKIVHIEQDVKPSSYPKVFSAKTLAQYVLETNANYVSKHNIKVGDAVSF